MHMTRRAALAGAAMAGATAGASAAGGEARGNDGVYVHEQGAMRLTVLSDGQMGFPAWPAYAPDASEAAVHAAMRREGLAPPTYRLDANAVLIETGGRRLLVDTGWGGFDPAVGRLPARLAAAGIAPATIDTVVLTHIHPDHVGGLLDAEGRPAFPAAEIVVAEEELAQWRARDFGAMRIGEGFRPVFETAAARVLGLADRLRPVAGGATLAAGVRALALPGHTAGHMGLRLGPEAGEGAIVLAGDAVHDPAFDLAEPGWATVFDHDPARAEATRRGLLAEAASSGARLLGYHMPFPGIGRVAPAGRGWRWIPERWRVG